MLRYMCLSQRALIRKVLKNELVFNVFSDFLHHRSVIRYIGPACIDNSPKCIRDEGISRTIRLSAVVEFHQDLAFTKKIIVRNLTG
jgi:hypothetical protein